jgi:hypothetical protein
VARQRKISRHRPPLCPSAERGWSSSPVRPTAIFLMAARAMAGSRRRAGDSPHLSKPRAARTISRRRAAGSQRSGNTAGIRPATVLAALRTTAAARSAAKVCPLREGPPGRCPTIPEEEEADPEPVHTSLALRDPALPGQLFHLISGRHSPGCGTIVHDDRIEHNENRWQAARNGVFRG